MHARGVLVSVSRIPAHAGPLPQLLSTVLWPLWLPVDTPEEGWWWCMCA